MRTGSSPVSAAAGKEHSRSLQAAMAAATEPLSISSVQAALHVVVPAARIKKSATCHTLLHSFATHLLEDGVPIRQVSTYLGHSNLASTLVYLHYAYHSCNHRACPRCGAAEQAQWTRKQEARLLPVPYYLLTLTAPAEMRGVFVPAFFAAIADAPKALCARSKFLGGNIGFIAILHTWTRRMLFLHTK